MASREKRALAPSKSRQKANYDSSSSSLVKLTNTPSVLSSESQRLKKLTAQLRSANNQLECSKINESSLLATGSQLSSVEVPKNLPRKRAVLQTALKRKQKASKTLIKAKQKQQQVVKTSLKRRLVTVDAKISAGRIKGKKKNSLLFDSPGETNAKFSKSSFVKIKLKLKKQLNFFFFLECKTAKKNKTLVKVEVHQSEDQTSPKLNRRDSNSISSSVRPRRRGTIVQNTSLNILNQIKKVDIVQVKRESKSDNENEEELKLIKSETIIDNSIDDTIEQVIASSMLVDTDVIVSKVKIEESFEGTKNQKNAKRNQKNGKFRQTSTNKVVNEDSTGTFFFYIKEIFL